MIKYNVFYKFIFVIFIHHEDMTVFRFDIYMNLSYTLLTVLLE